MASFSTLNKTYAKDKLSKCATTVLLVCCYLYRKRSYVIKTAAALFPLVHGDGHTTNAVGVISQDYKPLQCTTIVHASTEW